MENLLLLAGKDHNEILEIANPKEHTRDANAVSQSHVPENRGARASTF
jgi:hypothetical protein